MKLTSKRFMQSVVVSAGLAALPSFATDYVTESFENYGVGSYITTVTGWACTNGSGATPDGVGIVSNETVTTDSKLTSMGYDRFIGTSQTNVLVLTTEGLTLTRSVGATIGSGLWVDTMIRFVKSDEVPALDTSKCKVAFYVGVDPTTLATNLVIVSSSTATSTPIYTTNNVAMDLSKWYRLTVKQFSDANGYWAYVYLNGVQINPSTQVYPDDAKAFYPFDGQGTSAGTLADVAFQGTGAVDELVVTDATPEFGSAVVAITVTGIGDYLTVATNDVALADGATVPTDTTLTVTVANWYEIASVAAEGVTMDPALAVGDKNTKTVKVSATANSTLALTTQKYQSTENVSFNGGNTVAGDKVATWALAKGVTPDQVANNANAYTSYLLNKGIDAGIVYGFAIDSIAVSGTTATISLAYTTNNVVTAENITNDINGTVYAELIQTLGQAPIATNNLTITSGTTKYNVPMGDAKFIKAQIK